MAQTKLSEDSSYSITIFDKDKFNTDYLHHIKEVIKGNGLSEISKMQDALDSSDNDYISFLNHFYSISHNSERKSFLASYKAIKYNAQQSGWVISKPKDSDLFWSIVEYGRYYYASYFQESWYCQPTIHFSKDFLEKIFTEDQAEVYFQNPACCQKDYTGLYHGYMDFDVGGFMTFIYQLTPEMVLELKGQIQKNKHKVDERLTFEVEMLEKILDLTIEDKSIILVNQYFD